MCIYVIRNQYKGSSTRWVPIAFYFFSRFPDLVFDLVSARCLGHNFPNRGKRSQEFRQSCILPGHIPLRRYDNFTHQVNILLSNRHIDGCERR